MYILRLGKMWLFFACVAIAAFVANQNLAEITINFRPFVSYPIVLPAYQALFIAFVLGATATMLLLGTAYYGKAFTVRRLRKKLRGFEREQAAAAYDPKISSETIGEPGMRRPRIDRDLLSVRD